MFTNNKKIHIVVPMAGRGKRFENSGFDLPKPLINLYGYPIFYYSINSIVKFIDFYDVIFAVLNEHVDKYFINIKIDDYICYYDNWIKNQKNVKYANENIKKTLLDKNNNIVNIEKKHKIVKIDRILNGPVLTCIEAVKEIDDNNPIIFNDCDHAFICNSFNDFCFNKSFDEVDGALLTFDSTEPCYSYVKFNDFGNVCSTKEKEVISNEAICGAYYFCNKNIFMHYANQYLQKCSYGEYFMSGLYNEMCKDNLKIITFKCEKHISFGTPKEIKKVNKADLMEFLL